MLRSLLAYALAVLLCTAMFFSCTSKIEPPPPFEELGSSSSIEPPPIEPPPIPPPYEPSSSSYFPNIPPPISSATEQPPPPPPPPSSSSVEIVLPPSSSSVAKSSSSPAQIVSGCYENNPKAGFTCAWDKTGIITPGTIIAPAAYTLPSGCTSVAWKYAPDTDDMFLIYECMKTDENGFAALGSKNYVLFAELTCEDGKHTTACNPKTGLSTRLAPELTGECKWDRNPPVTSTARGAIPNGVKVVDADKICTSPTVVYKYEGGTKTWPATGILDEWKSWDKKHKETYQVEATLNCLTYSAPVTVACPPLEVSAGAEHLIECTCPGNGQCQLDEKLCKADSKAGREVTLKVDECVELNVYGYDNQHYLPKVGMRCQSNGSSYTVSINGKSVTGSNDILLLGKMKLGDNEFGTFCLTNLSGGTNLNGSSITSVKCNLNAE